MKFVLSMRIDDWRYRHEDDKIMTALFETYLHGYKPDEFKEEHVHAADDLEEVKWFDLNTFSDNENEWTTNSIITQTHKPLMNAFIAKLKEQGRYGT